MMIGKPRYWCVDGCGKKVKFTESDDGDTAYVCLSCGKVIARTRKELFESIGKKYRPAIQYYQREPKLKGTHAQRV